MAADHDQAKQDYLNGMKYKDLAEKYGVTLDTIKSWKQRYKWDRKGVHTKIEKVCTQKDKSVQSGSKKCEHKKRGAPFGSRNALGNRGGNGAPPGNDHATKHGFFKRIFPDDEETMALLDEIQLKSPIEILWDQIQIQYLAIARAQKLMWVRDQDDRTEVLKRVRRGRNPEKEWELQHAWDKHANFLQAQSRAITALERLIARYEQMLFKDLETEEQQLRIEKMRVEIDKIKNPGDIDMQNYLDALKTTAQEIWDDEPAENGVGADANPD